jgi:DNA-binding NtrC family response regulator
VVERLLLLADAEVDRDAVELALPAAGRTEGRPAASAATGTLAGRVEVFERETVAAELERHNGHMTETARALGLERSHLYKKCQQLGIDLRAMRKAE